MTVDPRFFQGELVNDRPTNEFDLLRHCPAEFRDSENPWNVYASRLFHEGGMFTSWDWKQMSRADKAELEVKFTNLLRATNSQLSDENRVAILAWMLGEMLSDVPERTVA